MQRVPKQSKQVKTDEQQRKRSQRNWNSLVTDSSRGRVVKLRGKDDELVLGEEPFNHPAVAAADRVGGNDLVIEDGDSHGGVAARQRVHNTYLSNLLSRKGLYLFYQEGASLDAHGSPEFRYVTTSSALLTE
jgi:hypothetical protein